MFTITDMEKDITVKNRYVTDVPQFSIPRMVNNINQHFLEGVRYCLLCNSITEKCSKHANPVVKVCRECWNQQERDSINFNNGEFFITTAIYSNGKLYDDFIRVDPAKRFVKLTQRKIDKKQRRTGRHTKHRNHDPTPEPSAPPADNYYQQFDNPKEVYESDVEDEETCTICFDKIINTVVVPCGHTIMCDSCATLYINNPKNMATGCPLCRTPIGQIVKTYKP